MFETEEDRQRAEIIIMMLAKLYVVLEFSPDPCPVCRQNFTHDAECPIALAWFLLDQEQQNTARTTIRTLALTLGCDEAVADPLAH